MNPFFMGDITGGYESSRMPATGGSSAAADRALNRAQSLEARLDRAMLTMEALWSLLRDRVGITEDELRDRIMDIDLTDGALDGKVRRPPRECPACKRKVPHRLNQCMYCGAEAPRDPFA